MEKEELRELGPKVLELRERTEFLLENVRNDFAGFCIDLASRLAAFLGREYPAVITLEQLGRKLALATLASAGR